MVHVFVLLLYLGVGKERVLESDTMFFASLSSCNWHAKEIVRRWGYLSNSDDFGTAYCVPRIVDTEKVRVYD